MALGLLRGVNGQAGGNDPEEGHGGEGLLTREVGGHEAAGLTLEAVEGALADQGVDVALDAERTGEAEVGLDLAERGCHAVLPMVLMDEVEDLALAVGEGRIAHSVQVNTFSG